MNEIFIFIIKILFILYFCGYGLTALFLPERLRKDSFFIIPWLGIIFSVLLGVLLTMLKIPLNTGKYLILAAASVLLLYSFVKKKIITEFSKKTIIISLLTLVILLFNLFPLLAKPGFPTTISLGNLDPISYTNVGEYLINNSYAEGSKPVLLHPHLTAVGDLLFYSYRWGSPMLLGLISSLLNIRSYAIYYILITLFFSLTFPLVFLLAKSFYSKKENTLLILIFLTYGMNSILLYMLYNVFFAQFLFSGIFILSLYFFNNYLQDRKLHSKKFNHYDLLISICLSATTTVYPEGIIFVGVPLVIFFIFKFFTKERINVLLIFFKIGVLTILINPITLGTSIIWNFKVFLLTTKTSFIGWEKIRYATPFEITGFYNLFYYQNLLSYIDLLTSIPVVLISIFGLIKIKNKIFMTSYLIIFGLFYFLYRFIYLNYYTHLKTVSFMLFLFSIIFSIGLIEIFNLIKNKKIQLLIMLIFLVLSLRSAYRTMIQLYYHQRIVDKKILSLIELNNNKKINKVFLTSDVILGQYDLWKRLWQEYILNNKKIITLTNYTSNIDKAKKINLVLSEKGITEYDNKKIKYKKIIWENDFYQLGEIEPLVVWSDL